MPVLRGFSGFDYLAKAECDQPPNARMKHGWTGSAAVGESPWLSRVKRLPEPPHKAMGEW